MRAAVLTEVNKPLQILDLEQEGPKAGEVRVQVKAAGVCLSDYHIMNGDWPLPLPMVLGHEAAGIVVELGPGVDQRQEGRPRHLLVPPQLRALPLLRPGPLGDLQRPQRQRRAGACTTAPRA